MKKALCLIIAFMLCVSFASCDGKEKVTYKIGVLVDNIDNDFTQLYASLLSDSFTQRESGKIQYDVTILSSVNSHSRQVSQVEMFAAQHYDILIIDCVDEENALDLVEKAVDMYNADEINGEDTQNDNDKEENKTKSPATQSDSSEFLAEPKNRVENIYVPNMQGKAIPIVFIKGNPVLEKITTENEAEATEEATKENGNENAEEDKIIDTALCRNVPFDKESLAKNIIAEIKDLPMRGDKNKNGVTEYAFVCSDAINDDYKQIIDEVASYFTDNNIEAKEVFSYFAQNSSSDFETAVRDKITQNGENLDIVICLTDKALISVNNLSYPLATTEDNSEDVNEDNEENKPKLYQIGKDYNVIAVGLESSTKDFVDSGVIDKYISYDYEKMVNSAVDMVISYLEDGVEGNSFNEELESLGYIIVYKEENSKK